MQQYQIVMAFDKGKGACLCVEELERKVNSLCQCGWKTQGGVSVTVKDDGYNYQYTMCQAMIKEDSKK